MKRTYEIIRKVAVAVCALIAMSGWLDVWGQQYISGNRYKTSYTRTPQYIFNQGDATITTDGGTTHGDVNDLLLENATWWQSDNNVNDDTYIQIDLKEAKRISRIYIVGSGSENTRPTYIQVSTRNNGRDWTQRYSAQLSQQTRDIDITLNNTIQARYIRLNFWTGESNQIVVDRIRLYDEAISISNTANQTIQHKDAKWYSLRGTLSEQSKALDTFDDNTRRFINEYANNTSIQATHTYIDTLYVHKGQRFELQLPTVSNGENQNSAQKYQRWYNFRTEGTFRTDNNGNNECWDLLTPYFNENYADAYRFTNGYVGGHDLMANNESAMFGASFYYPTNTQFNDWNIENGEAGNDAYIVACDISGYTDFTSSFSTSTSHESDFSDNWYEPTIQLRVLYFIVGIDNLSERMSNSDFWKDGYGRLFDGTDYQGGYGANKKFLEEYQITFPADHISNFTDEIVALSKSARNYRIPGDGNSQSLHVSIVGTNSAGIELVSAKGSNNTVTNFDLSGDNRVIYFRKRDEDPRTRWSVADNSTTTIIVTKVVGNTTYNIAKYELTFKEESRLLTQHQLERIDADNSNYLQDFANRTPNHLKENYELLTSRTFDYDPDVAETYGQAEYYPYPLSWEYSSYAFYDGGYINDFDGSTTNLSQYGNQPFTEWGSYSIVNDYMGYDDKINGPAITDTDEHRGGRGTEGQTGYFLYVDASDLPGSIVTLPFDDDLCVGTELFVSAWVKSAGADISRNDDGTPNYSDSSDDAAMLLTIYGVDANGNRTVLHRQSTGQIRKTTYNDGRQNSDYTGTNGFGSGNNDWYQTYFSFINDNPANENFESYELQIDNNSASTQGGDFYLDDIMLYIARPVPVVSQKEYTCVDERTLMNAYLDWGQLCERLGLDEDGTSSGESAIDFCFIDKVVYETTLNGSTNEEDIKKAIKASIQLIGNGESLNEEIVTLFFHENFSSNKEYNPNGTNLIVDNTEDGNYYFYRTGTGTSRRLTTDFYATLSPYRQYEMLIIDHTGTKATISDFAGIMNDKCAIRSEFYVQPQTLMKVNGEVVDPNQDFCEGQIFNFTAQVRVPTGTDSEGNDTYTILNDVNFDWFFGTEEEFNQQNANFGGVSLNEALTQFREIEAYWGYETLDGVAPQEAFTQNHIDIIQHYLDAEGEAGGLHKRLILCKPNLDISILGTGLQLVVRPIPVVRPSNITEDAWDKICWEYVPLLLEASEAAPILHAGFNTVAYPTDDFNPSIRLGLAQIEKASSGNNTITIDLRGAQYASEGVTHLGLIESITEGDMYQKIYLHSSDDPQYADILNNEAMSGEYSLPIGKITELYAQEYATSTAFNNYAKIQFDLSSQTLEDGSTFQFTPREGYTYTFSINYEEKGTGVYNTCWGKFPVTMKVVPEYLIWNGTNDGKSNWNNDNNWKRVNTPSRLKQSGSGYLDNNDTEKAFVPMLFSKVIMPENSKVELYAAGFTDNGDKDGWTGVDNRPEGMGDPTENIQYDLMVFEHTASTNPSYTGQLKTERYRVSLCDQIHFEPGAEMLHAEYLLYKTAWVDYKLQKGRWYTLASPLQNVVAGDFYTDKEGTEKSEYFKQIPDFNLTDNNRFQPSVYQRGWKGSNATLQTLNDNTKNVAISGNWSSVYNDVDEQYIPGTGFSLKVQDVTTTDATFRLPKHDTNYSYFSHGQTSGNGDHTSGTIDRTKYGKLISDDTFTRNTNMNDAREGTDIEVPLTEVPSNTNSGTTYYLVGNPFMAHLDAKSFFETNTAFEDKYWLVEEGTTSQTAAIGSVGGEGFLTTTTGRAAIAPLQSFFIKLAEGQSDPENITFTRDMQVLGGTNDNLRSTDVLYLTAITPDGKQSRAALAYNLAADKDYEANEDAELFLDSNLSDVPTVYTVAGTMATSINQTSELYNIPVGVYSARATNENVSLSFSNLNGFSYATLYDAETGTDTPLHEGSSFSIPANTNGRYFLRAGVPTANEAVQENAIRIYSVGGQLVIASTDPLQQVYIYDFAGRLVDSETRLHTTRYTTDLPAGNYMVKARSVSGEKIEKFKLRN